MHSIRLAGRGWGVGWGVVATEVTRSFAERCVCLNIFSGLTKNLLLLGQPMKSCYPININEL